ncbi:hypothetical protein A3A46_03100 [Candidatus Roizmanbacteria bacterium RIFCSPLOWO2_01_FULL_37_13]|uniref:VanZ-like domain-containing protein n=1 Tax=Candidatus Roizmanbacteria bacterium RIFCSPHIGHO2_02_FULL_38_11 TaxID=1802039 RepID=A0A1F7GWS5_9BACT|nr:MAG: hypothetical protein A3C25_01935 [Candidatus Roizmanbacteria bacterium RIFCSPHIGHO2_02_FULL_38_11]OGK43120.1 MAG: hypothetical protein A3A46_03100 [Candidatus Roizmanbacteria bacterium RIFCSPLOWO2_01_FULL_37_13]
MLECCIILFMGKFSRFIRYWLPPIIWMALIFYLSSRLRVSATGKFLFDFLIFKALHVIEYAILYLLLFRAFYSIKNQQPARNATPASNASHSDAGWHSVAGGLTISKKFLYPIIISILYAVLDELHQTFVPTREGKLRDAIIDAAGIILMYIYIKNNLKIIKKFL